MRFSGSPGFCCPYDHILNEPNNIRVIPDLVDDFLWFLWG